MIDHHRPARRQALPIFLGFLVSAALAVTTMRCTSRDPAQPVATSPAPTQGSEGAVNTASPPAQAEPAPARTAAAPTSTTPDAGTNTIGRLMKVTDAHDRSLLSRIERKAQREPDATVYQLLELRRAGKPRAELERFIQTELKGGLAVRVIAMRWLRSIHGEPESEADGKPLLRGPDEPDPQPRTVKPLTKTAQ